MAFFSSCSGLNIYGGNFTNYQTEDGAATQALGKRKRQDSECDSFRKHRRRIFDSDGLRILTAGDVKLRREFISDGNNSYRIHAASHGRRLVVVKTFEGPRAKQDWKMNVAFSKECLHPNVLRIVGISDESSKSHFIQFRGITSEQKMQGLIANALGTDLNTSVQLSMKAVKGIAAGLSYIKYQRIPVMYAGAMNNNEKWDNFDILTGYDNEPIIALHLSSTEDSSVSHNLDIETDSSGIKVLNGLCDQLFSGANSILYDDSPEREFDVYDSEGLPEATLEHDESTSNLSEGEAISNHSNPMENPKPSRKPRREVWWVDLGATNHSLKSIGRCFADRLNRSLVSSSNSLLRRIRSPKDDNLRRKFRRNLHKCPGYLREEITLTCDLSKSVIVSHAFPGLSERCSVCHQLVQYTYSESFDHNTPLCPSPTTSSSPSPPMEGALTSDHFAPVGGTDLFMPDIGVKSSDASSVMHVMGELFQPSLPETTVSSSSQLPTGLTNHVLNHPIRRPRTTTKVFQSSKALAAHYGIPELLPPAPRISTLQQSAKSPLIDFQTPLIDFQTLSSNYLSMLSRNPSDNANMIDPVAPLPTSVSLEESSAPVIPDKDVDGAKSLPARLAFPQSDAWEMVTPSPMDDFSPWSPDLMNPYLSPPQDLTMDTPLFDYLDESQMLVGPDYSPMLPMFPDWEDFREPVAEPKSLLELDPSTFIIMTPTSPLLDSFDPSTLAEKDTVYF